MERWGKLEIKGEDGTCRHTKALLISKSIPSVGPQYRHSKAPDSDFCMYQIVVNNYSCI